MAQLTQELTLTSTWQEVSTEGFIGQKDQSSTIEVCNADALPSGDVVTHTVGESANLQFPTPASGSWYARVRSGTATLVYTEV